MHIWQSQSLSGELWSKHFPLDELGRNGQAFGSHFLGPVQEECGFAWKAEMDPESANSWRLSSHFTFLQLNGKFLLEGISKQYSSLADTMIHRV